MSLTRRNEIMARKHVQELRNVLYKDWIQDSIDKTIIYEGTLEPKKGDVEPKIKIANSGVVKAIFNKPVGETCVLNFADFVEPGGAFIRGGNAQEEAICMASTLYPVLCAYKEEYYDANAKDINNHLYRNKALYTPDVLFLEGRRRTRASVITCAAPNLIKAEQVKGFNLEDNVKALVDRIKFVLAIAEDNDVNTLILGAWGCGVFGQDVIQVARLFKYLITTHCSIPNIVFAIPDGKKYNMFKNIFENEDIDEYINSIITEDEVEAEVEVVVEITVTETSKVDNNNAIKVGDMIELPRMLIVGSTFVPEGEICKVVAINNGTYDIETKSGVIIESVML